MIEGLKIKVSSAELATHLKVRAAYHEERVKEKEEALPKVAESLKLVAASKVASPSSVSNMSGKSNYHFDADDPVEALENDIRDHKNKAMVFRYYAAHLFEEDYILREEDLIRLEILKRW